LNTDAKFPARIPTVKKSRGEEKHMSDLTTVAEKLQDFYHDTYDLGSIKDSWDRVLDIHKHPNPVQLQSPTWDAFLVSLNPNLVRHGSTNIVGIITLDLDVDSDDDPQKGSDDEAFNPTEKWIDVEPNEEERLKMQKKGVGYTQPKIYLHLKVGNLYAIFHHLGDGEIGISVGELLELQPRETMLMQWHESTHGNWTGILQPCFTGNKKYTDVIDEASLFPEILKLTKAGRVYPSQIKAIKEEWVRFKARLAPARKKRKVQEED
jgi:hypothetical protein